MAYIQDWGMRVQAQPQINTTRRALLHLSQNENGRMLNIRITDVNIPSGSTAVLAGTKPDGTVYSQTGTLAGNTATFAEDVQMTAVAGTWDAKITITNGGNCICTARITITIDPDTVAGGAIPSDSQLDGIIAECRAIADSVRKEAYGSPLVADAVEDMTDQSRVYVYTGSESGMTAGHWYYYNGTAWTDGGVYNAVAVDIDTTLTIAGKAADAKKVGDELASVKEELSEYEGIFTADVDESVQNWLNEHPEATTTVEDGAITEAKLADSLKLKTIKDYVTPKMFGAKGDGIADDTNAIISAFNSGKTVFFPSGTYAVSQSIEINHDVRVICDAQCQIIPIANMYALFKIGVAVDGFTNPVFSGLVKVLWDGGTLFGAHSDYVVTDVIYTEKTYHCKFTNVTIANVSTNGIHIAGNTGAYCIFEKCVVRGKYGNGTRGFFIERSDQQILNCSVIDCLHGYEANANCILFDGCTAWMSSDTSWNNTMCFYLGGAFNKLVNCIVDTMYYGIRFKSNFKYGSASNLFWTNNYAVVKDTTNMSLLSTDDPGNGYLVNFPVIGLIVDNLQNTAYLKRDISSAYHTFIDNIVASNPSNIADLSTASCYIENKTYDNGNGTNRLQKTNNGLRFVHDSELSAVTPNTVITLSTWKFTSISGAIPVTCINNNTGELITTCALYCNNGILQFLLNGSTTYNLKLHVDIDVPQYSI